jgi:hypothetical protein
LRALAAWLGGPFVKRAATLAPGFDYRAALRASVARANADRESFDWLMAPRGAQVVDLIRADLLRMANDGATKRIALCAPRLFSALVRAMAQYALTEDASYALSRADARLSAYAPMVRWSNYLALGLSTAILAALAAASPGWLQIVSMVMSLFFLGGIFRPIRSWRPCVARRASPRNSSPR